MAGRTGEHRRAIVLPNWRSAFVSAALIGTMVISAVAAWGVHDANVEHREAIAASLEEYAKYAARTFGEQLIYEGEQLRLRALAPVLGTPALDAAAPMPLARFAAPSAAVLDAAGLGDDRFRGFFRLDPRRGAYEATGAAARGELAEAVRGAVWARLVGADRAREPLLAVARIDGEPVLIVFARQLTPDGSVVAVFGCTMSRTLAMGRLSRDILRRLPLVPPSFVSAEWRYGRPVAGGDTIVAIGVLDLGGRELYRSPRQFPSTVLGEFRFRTDPGGFVVRAALHPHLVERITALHRHDERRRIQFALPILTILLAAAAILNIVRERELVRARRDFVASVSHELRTPLAQIRMYSEMLLLGRERGEEERGRWLGVIGREARRLGDLVENILLFSHIDAARVRLEPERTDLGELVEDIVESYVPMAASRGMRLLADAPARIVADVDPRAMRQVVVNLLDNALKYGPEGQTVRVELERDGARALLAISDQGPGVSREDRERLWRPFVRLRRTGSSSAGSGIGLSVVRSIVEQHEGSVEVVDAEGGGARFVVRLPLAAPAARPVPEPPAPVGVPGAGANEGVPRA
jgi:signal transduction histidine kinase